MSREWVQDDNQKEVVNIKSTIEITPQRIQLNIISYPSILQPCPLNLYVLCHIGGLWECCSQTTIMCEDLWEVN